jgi:hypothetical protein
VWKITALLANSEAAHGTAARREPRPPNQRLAKITTAERRTTLTPYHEFHSPSKKRTPATTPTVSVRTGRPDAGGPAVQHSGGGLGGAHPARRQPARHRSAPVHPDGRRRAGRLDDPDQPLEVGSEGFEGSARAEVGKLGWWGKPGDSLLGRTLLARSERSATRTRSLGHGIQVRTEPRLSSQRGLRFQVNHG